MKETKAYKTYLVSPKEPTKKSKRVKRHAKKSSKAPAGGVVVRETPEIPLSKKKEKMNVEKRKGIDLLFEVALTKEARYDEVRKKSLKDFYKTHPSGSGTVTKTASSDAKIKPFVENERTRVKPRVPDVTEEESSERSDQDKDSGDDNTQSNSEKGLDSEHETDENESGSESDLEENKEEDETDEEEKEDEYVRTPSYYSPTDDKDRTNVDDNAECDKDEEMDYSTSQLYDDVDIWLNEPVDADEGFIQKEGTNDEMINKSEVPVTSSSHSTDLAAKFINFADIPTTEAEIVSPMDVHVHHEVPSKKTLTLLTVADSDMPQDQEESPGNDDEEPKGKVVSKRDWFTKPKRPQEPTDPDWNDEKTPQQGPTQRWLMTLTSSADKPSKTFDELMSTPIDFSAYIMNGLKIPNLTQETLLRPTFKLLKGTRSNYAELEYDFEECYKALSEKLDWDNLEGSDYPFYLTKPLYLVMNRNRQMVPVDYFFNNGLKYLQGGISTVTYTTSSTKTKAAQYYLPDIEDMSFYGYARGLESNHDVYYTKCILAVTRVEVMRKHGYGYLKEIVVRRADNDLYKFKESDFPRLRINDIEDMLLLVVQNRLINFSGDDVFDFAITLRMFTRSIVIQKRVEDLQLAVESYQKKINVTKPETTKPDIRKKDLYTPNQDPQGFIYVDTLGRNRLMRSDKLYKFSDGTLTRLQTSLKDITKNIHMAKLKDEDPSTGSGRGLKKRKTSKDAEPKKGSKAKESESGSSKGASYQTKSFGKSVQSEELKFVVADSDMPQDQEENPGNDDEEPKRKVESKHDWFTKPKQPQEPTDPDWNDRKTPQQGPTQSWLMTLTSSTDKPSKTFDELMSTTIDFSTYIMNCLKISNLTQETLLWPAFKLLKSTCSNYTELDFEEKCLNIAPKCS
nr:hypothetical protein [Tanacetum cinerariifolium]